VGRKEGLCLVWPPGGSREDGNSGTPGDGGAKVGVEGGNKENKGHMINNEVKERREVGQQQPVGTWLGNPRVGRLKFGLVRRRVASWPPGHGREALEQGTGGPALLWGDSVVSRVVL